MRPTVVVRETNMSVGFSHSALPIRGSSWTLADLSKLALPSRTRRLGALRRRVENGQYLVEPKAISRQITDFYRSPEVDDLSPTVGAGRQ